MTSRSLTLAVFVLFSACWLAAGCVSDIVAPTEDEAPILPPTNVIATSSEVSKVVISWDPSSHPQLRGYRVYRVENVSQQSELLTSTSIADTCYNDASARRGVGYQYRVTALTKAGKESAYASVDVMLQAEQREGPNREM
jgi:fibronectin type 3 domain-containing protein